MRTRPVEVIDILIEYWHKISGPVILFCIIEEISRTPLYGGE